MDEAPAGVGLVILGVVAGENAGEKSRRDARVGSGMQRGLSLDAGAGGWIGDDGLEHRRHESRLQEALAFYDLRAVRSEDDGGGPAVVLIPVGDVGPRVLIDLDEHVSLVQKPNPLRVAVGDIVHDMTPVTPDGFEIEQDELVLLTSGSECSVRPRLPVKGWLIRS